MMATTKTKLSLADRVKIALDGRTQRWLALEIKMPEHILSLKLRGEQDFTDEEIETINKRLQSNIKK